VRSLQHRRAAGRGGRALTIMRWGLVPSWARDIRIGASLINARAETVADKPAFRAAYRHRRCLVPADGFYEWQKTAGGKLPWRVARRDRSPFAFAGLWELWEGTGEGSALETFSILTVDANAAIRDIHHRMPVMLFDAAEFELWLAGRPDAAAGLLRPCDAAAIEAWPVDKRVGNVRHDDPALAEPADQPASPPGPPPPAAQGSLF
jgi:putative SOS response-associated peptidase YedK